MPESASRGGGGCKKNLAREVSGLEGVCSGGVWSCGVSGPRRVWSRGCLVPGCLVQGGVCFGGVSGPRGISGPGGVSGPRRGVWSGGMSTPRGVWYPSMH